MRAFRCGLVGMLALVACLASSASSTASTITISSAPTAEFGVLNLDPGGLGLACNVTFGIGSLSRSMTAISLPATLLNVGSINRFTSSGCSGGATLTALGLPWPIHATISGGAGGVSDTTTWTIAAARLHASVGGLTCLYGGNVSRSINTGGTASLTNTSIPLISGNPLCPRPAGIMASLSLFPFYLATLR